MSNQTGVLYVVATPIGNMEDISRRAERILNEVDLILAEDTRHSGHLLKQLVISTPTQSLHDHNELDRVPMIIRELQNGKNLALISDAGTPLISDPGYHLIDALQQQGLRVCPIPGASAVITALSAAGLASDRFSFEGFLPAKRVNRKDTYSELLNETRTLIFYESPHRIMESLADAIDIFGGDRLAAIARELTKLHEDIKRGTLQDLYTWLQENTEKQRGEFVLMISGNGEPVREEELEVRRILSVLLKELPTKKAAEMAADITGQKKNQLYQMALEIKDSE